MKKRIVAVVPVRSGSERVPNKNFKNFLNTNLLTLKIQVLKNVPDIDEIIINSDSSEAQSIAQKLGVGFHMREKYYASSIISNDEHWYHLAKTTPNADILLIAQVTSPLISAVSISKGIKMLVDNYKEIDSVNSVSKECKYLWFDDLPLNYDYANTPRSQELPDYYSLNFALSIIKREALLEDKNLVSKKHKFVTLSKIESFDIDDDEDFFITETLAKELGFNSLLKNDFREISDNNDF